MNKNEEPIAVLSNSKNSDQKITLLGTAHISQSSADQVEAMLNSGEFDTVAIELCDSRYKSIKDPDALAHMDLFQVIRQGKATMIAANLALGAFQQRMAEELDVKPGAEMRVAIEIAESKNIKMLLVDREIAITLKRVYRNVPWWQRMNLVAGLMASVVSRQKVTEDEIEKLKSGDMLESVFSQFAEEAEAIYRPLVDERDQYMAARLQHESDLDSFKQVLVVIGAGHLAGIKDYLTRDGQWQDCGDHSNMVESTEKSSLSKPKFSRLAENATAIVQNPLKVIEQLLILPKGGQWLKIIPWIIVALVILGFAIGFSRNSDLGWQLVAYWVVLNGGLSAIGALIAFAHPITVIVAFLAAPLTSLNPTIGAGMVTGAVEAYIRKPTVADFSKLRSDTTSIKGWWKNRVTRVLLVFILSTLGSAAGTYIAGFKIFEQLT